MSKITIELTEKVAFEFLDRKLEFLETEHLPYKEFDLKFPMSVYLTEEKVLSDTLDRLPVPKESLMEEQLKMMRKVARDYSSSLLTVSFKHDKNICVDVADSLNHKVFSMELNMEFIFIPNIKRNEITREPFSFSYRILSIIAHTLKYISEPKKEVLVSQTRETKNSGKSKKKRSGGKTYIYKKTYRILDVESKLEKREYNRIRENWGVRGHWRQYKSGKKVWIDEHIRGNKEEAQDIQEYRITKIDR